MDVLRKRVSSLEMVDFDDIDDWEPELSAALLAYLPDSFRLKLTAAAPEYIEDARAILFDLTNRDVLIEATLAWIRSIEVVGYHFDYFASTLPPIYNNSDWECLAVRKLCFGERLRSKNETAQINEALTKVLCHNLVVMIESMYELNITPDFWREAA